MDFNLLVDEILARVSGVLSDVDLGKNSTMDKDKILILTEHHGISCHEMLENSNLKKYYNIDCALEKEYNCELNEYKLIILYNLSNDALSKLAGGICDTQFTSLASRAILMGKKIYIPSEEVELYQYKQSAPDAYYSMMNEKLEFLRTSGVILCQQNELENLILEGCKTQLDSKEINVIRICKKVITESDIRKVDAEGVTSISINSNAILTDLAKDYIHGRNIKITKDSFTDGKLGKNL